MPRQAALPPTLSPRLISREAAAAYACVSPTTFDAMVEQNRMPRPRNIIGRRKGWDVRELDAAIDDLPHDSDELAASDQGWDD